MSLTLFSLTTELSWGNLDHHLEELEFVHVCSEIISIGLPRHTVRLNNGDPILYLPLTDHPLRSGLARSRERRPAALPVLYLPPLG